MDPRLGSFIESVGPCALGFDRVPFDVLARSIIGQQLSVNAAEAISSRVLDVLGHSRPFLPSDFISVRSNRILKCGLSKSKLKFLKGLAQSVKGGVLDFDSLHLLGDEEVIDCLTQFHGIGPWTAQMFLIFGLRRLDVMSLADAGLRRGLQIVYGYSKRPTDSQVMAVTRRWSPYRSIGSWYLWRAADGG